VGPEPSFCRGGGGLAVEDALERSISSRRACTCRSSALDVSRGDEVEPVMLDNMSLSLEASFRRKWGAAVDWRRGNGVEVSVWRDKVRGMDRDIA
jgi:hypothetical protein